MPLSQLDFALMDIISPGLCANEPVTPGKSQERNVQSLPGISH